MGETIIIELAVGYARRWLRDTERATATNADHSVLQRLIREAIATQGELPQGALRATKQDATIELDANELHLLMSILNDRQREAENEAAMEGREVDEEPSRFRERLMGKVASGIMAIDVVRELERKVGVE